MTFIEEQLQLETPSGLLCGSLMKPINADVVALIIAGSGPTDRDGNNRLVPAAQSPLKQLAEGLAQAGIASLRCDKRGIGESVKTPESELRFDTLVQDVTQWIQALRNDHGFKHLVVIGHSEGSLIGMLAALDTSIKIDAFVSIAGSASPAADVLREQLASRLDPELLQVNETILKSLCAGKTIEPPVDLAVFYRSSIQPYLISWFKHSPKVHFAKLGMPCLIVQGDMDGQVGVHHAKALHMSNQQSQLKIIEGMGHVEIIPAALDSMTSFIKERLALALKR